MVNLVALIIMGSVGIIAVIAVAVAIVICSLDSKE